MIAKNAAIELQKISHVKCGELFGIVDVEKLAKEHIENEFPVEEYSDRKYDLTKANSEVDFIKGFDKAMKLNKEKQFTLGDMKRAFNCGRDSESIDRFEDWRTFTHFIDSLQPTEIEVEIEMRTASLVYKTDEILPKLDSEGCLILKKI
jgi:hypothetical protein